MSFIFPTWTFPPSFHEAAKEMLEGALNKGSKPPIISGRISVTELNMGKDPPTLTLLEIGDLSMERFRGIFRLSYQGDAWLEVKCRVQANPLSHNPHLAAHATLPLNAPLIASQPLLVPMTLRLSSLNLRAILILVVSKSKGITLVFKNDPLQNVDVSSTFDSVEVIRGYLQKEIEGQLREMFREDLPVIIHRLSQQWFAGTGVGGRVEMPYREEEQEPVRSSTSDDEEPTPEPINSFGTSPARPSALRDADSADPSPSNRRRTSRTVSERKSLSAVDDTPTSYASFPDMERYDPTYGMRPEGLPSHSGYEAFGKLFEKTKEGKRKGLGALMDLAEEASSIGAGGVGGNEDGLSDSGDEGTYADPGDASEGSEDEDGHSVNIVDGNPALASRPRPRLHSDLRGSSRSILSLSRGQQHRQGVEFETVPMAGGGTISRPRIFHVQSQIRAPSEVGYPGSVYYNTSGTMANGTAGSVTARASSVRSSNAGSVFGFGQARSNVTEMGRHRTSSRMNGNGEGSSGTGAGTFAMAPRPGLSRQHSRAESVPAFPFAEQIAVPQRNMLAIAAMNNNNRASGGMGSAGSEIQRPAGPSRAATYQRSDSKPPPLAQHPSAKFITPPRARRTSMSQQVGLSGSPPAWPTGSMGKSKSNQIVVPMNDSVSQLATLYHSNHTLSPYARGHEHIAVRSFPHLSRASSTYSAPINGLGGFPGGGGGAHSAISLGLTGTGHQTSKGQRKRIYRMRTSGSREEEKGASRRQSLGSE